MSAKQRGLIGAIIGAVLLAVCYGIAAVDAGEFEVGQVFVMILAGALYGFGFAFGWGYMKSMTSALLGVAAGASLLTILFSRQNTLIKVLFIYLIAISLGVGLAWIPGIFKGIGSIRREAAGY